MYIRLSKEDDREGQSDSVSNQLSMLRDFTKERRLDVSQRGYCKRRRESVDGQGFLRSCIEKDRSALIVSAGKTHKIKSGCLLNVTEIRTSEIEARAIHKQEFLTFLYPNLNSAKTKRLPRESSLLILFVLRA